MFWIVLAMVSSYLANKGRSFAKFYPLGESFDLKLFIIVRFLRNVMADDC